MGTPSSVYLTPQQSALVLCVGVCRYTSLNNQYVKMRTLQLVSERWAISTCNDSEMNLQSGS